MSTDRLNKVLIGMEEDFSSGHRIGLANVYQRIKHIYGEEGSMSIQSEEEVGTIVSISLSATRSHAADPSPEGAAMDESTRRR
jgi:sensor histidine kinase YesM